MRRPWNIPDHPVYSLATYDQGVVNMNICTYVTSVSMNPKIYLVAVYHGTKTLSNLQNSDHAILQLLNKGHLGLINLLGKASGFAIDKKKKLTERGFIATWQGKEVMSNASAYLLLKKQKIITSGDHDSYFFSVEKFSSRSENTLMFSELIENKLILN